ncbi:MAG: chromosomal replication initiator protein DnaA [Solirubrobacteraceae bacterium]
MHDPLERTWSEVDAKLIAAVDDATYRIWLASLTLTAIDGSTVTIAAPSHSCGWIRERFGRLLQAAVAAVLGPAVVIDLVARAPRTAASARADRRGPTAIQSQHELDTASSASLDPDLFASPKLTFAQFVIGDSNRLAHAAALAVAEMPAQAYNPLFLCGPPGIGKTHLLGAIRALLLAYDPTTIVRCATGEQFTNEFLRALGGGSTERFKARYRHVDALLIDDVQFLERKTRTEEEFFHTFNSLYDGGRQLVLTSDRPPADLGALEDRLRERFASGLVADIRPPDHATRMTILRKRVHHDGVDLPGEGALHEIAARVTANVRTLEGALIRIVAFASLTGRPIDRALAAEVLDTLHPDSRPHPGQLRPGIATSIAAIQDATCERFGLTPAELTSNARSRRIAWPRQVAMYLARELTKESLPSIGRHIGGRDHTTVLHACRRASAAIDADTDVRNAVEDLRRRLSEAQS